MASWIGTRIFYALVFFLLGAWTASVSPGFKGLMRNVASLESFGKIRDWATTTLRSPGADERSTAAPPAASAANTAPSPATTADELLVRARDAYTRKDVLGAVNAYRAYIDRNPDALEARGELGNVYFAEGRRNDAAKMYVEVANRRLEAGDAAGAKALLGAVRQCDATLADELGRRIARAGGAGK